ncbi:MAG TPA: biopolymer transporter ExbD [Kofleriaceae bacterium]
MAMSSGGGDDDLKSEINVTPLVDVMLVLLIIFMITAPLLNNTGVTLELPQVAAENIEDPEGKLVMSISPDNKLFLGGTPISWTELEAKLKLNERVQKEGALYIEADQHLQYGVVITAMALARSAGVQHVMFLTDPSARLDLGKLDQGQLVTGASK